ncbi:MAG: hypothetical protein M1839_003230 [Geoglossum umbratile]|nr:MAG: hypothetical protein M1839_003230 [Geoglossum umbratile]
MAPKKRKNGSRTPIHGQGESAAAAASAGQQTARHSGDDTARGEGEWKRRRKGEEGDREGKEKKKMTARRVRKRGGDAIAVEREEREEERDEESSDDGEEGQEEEDDDDDDDDDDEFKPKRRAFSALRPGALRVAPPYETPPGSRCRLRWHEYFLDLPGDVEYEQWEGWQRVLDQIPSGSLDLIRGGHTTTDSRIPSETRLRIVPTLPDYIPRNAPVIVTQAFLYSNTGINWADIIARMGYTWSEPKEMYKINNKYSTAAGRWRNVIGVPAREPKLRRGQAGTTAFGSVNFAGINWDAYKELPPHVDPLPPPPPLPTIPARTRTRARGRSQQPHQRRDLAAATGDGLPNQGDAPAPAGRHRRLTFAERRAQAVASAAPQGAPGPSTGTATARRSQRIARRRTSGQSQSGLAAPQDVEMAEAEDDIASALNTRLALLSQQEIAARVAVDAAVRERQATLAQMIEGGYPIDPALREYDRVLDLARADAIASAQPAITTTQPTATTPPTLTARPSTPQTVFTIPPPGDSPPELPLCQPSALWNPTSMSQEVQELVDSLVHHPPVSGHTELESDNPLTYSEDEWERYMEYVRRESEDDEEMEGEQEDWMRFDLGAQRARMTTAEQVRLQLQAADYIQRSTSSGESSSQGPAAATDANRRAQADLDPHEFDWLLNEDGETEAQRNAAARGNWNSEEDSGHGSRGEGQEDDEVW